VVQFEARIRIRESLQRSRREPGWFEKEYFLDFLNMTAYHVWAPIWFLLSPET